MTNNDKPKASASDHLANDPGLMPGTGLARDSNARESNAMER